MILGSVATMCLNANAQIQTDTVCGLQFNLQPINSVTTGSWHAVDSLNCWFSSTSQNPPAVPSSVYNDIANVNNYTCSSSPNYKDFVWEYSVSGVTHYDTLRIIFAYRPSGSYIATSTACPNQDSKITANTSQSPANVDFSIIDFNWDIGNGFLEYPPNLNNKIIYVLWRLPDTSSFHLVSLITTNIWGCSSPINIDTVFESPHLNVPSYMVNPATGIENNGEVILSTENNSYMYEWISNTIQNPFDTIQYNLIPNYEYLIDYAGQSLSPENPGRICHDTLSIIVPVFQVASFYTEDITSTQSNLTIKLHNTSPDAESYYWTISNSSKTIVFTSTLREPTCTLARNDCYEISLDVTNGEVPQSWFGFSRPPCSGNYTLEDFCIWPLGVDVNKNKLICSISPNPANEYINISIEEQAILEIINIQGQVVEKKCLTEKTNNLDLSNLVSGVYTLRIKTDRGIAIRKVIKQ